MIIQKPVLIINTNYKDGTLRCGICNIPIHRGEKYFHQNFYNKICSVCLRELSSQTREEDIIKLKNRQIIESLKIDGKEDTEW